MDKREELEKLKDQYFMLQMCDHWSSEDYRLDNELYSKIMKLEKELNERR